MEFDERIERMNLALQAAQAVQAEIERRNSEDISAFRIEQRDPLLQRAIISVSDLRRRIRNLEAAQIGINLDQSVIEKLIPDASRLDDAIKVNALLDFSMESLTVVLNSIDKIKTTLA